MGSGQVIRHSALNRESVGLSPTFPAKVYNINMTHREALNEWLERSQAILDEYETKRAPTPLYVAHTAIKEVVDKPEIVAHSPNFYS